MNSIREILQINEQELQRGLAGTPASWHAKYKSAWVYVGNLDHALTEGDVICVLSQYGEIEDFHLVRDEATGKSRGFAFAKYEDSRSCVLAVDNFCGVPLCGRSLRVDHVENYRLPRHLAEKEERDAAVTVGAKTHAGHAYQGQELATGSKFSLQQGQDLFAPPITTAAAGEENADDKREGKPKRKEKKRQERNEKKKRNRERVEKNRMERDERKQRRARSTKDVDTGKADDPSEKLVKRKSEELGERQSRLDSEDERSGDKKKNRYEHKRTHGHRPSKERDSTDEQSSEKKPPRHSSKG